MFLCVDRFIVINIIFLFLIFFGDSEEQNNFTCINCSSNTLTKCRFCSCHRQHMNTGFIGDRRNTIELEIMAIEAETAWSEISSKTLEYKRFTFLIKTTSYTANERKIECKLHKLF